MEFKRSVLNADVYGEKVELSFPTVAQYRIFNEKLTDKKNKKSEIDLTIEFLEMLGMAKGLADKLEPAHLTEIINALTGVEAKK